jgi:hypothetical protein
MIFEYMVHSVQTVHLYCTNTNIVSKRTDTRFHMTHSPKNLIGCVQDDFLSLWYLQHKPRTYLAPRLALSLNGLKQLPLEPRHLGLLSGASKMISKPVVHSAETMHLYCTDTNTISKRTEMRFHIPTHLGVPSGASKTISEPMARSAQTAHLSCIKISTISKQT